MPNVKSSPIWNHFLLVESDRARCQHCSRVLAVCSGNTGNLRRHMNRKHSDIVVEPQLNRNSQESGNENVIYEFVVAGSSDQLSDTEKPPASPVKRPCAGAASNLHARASFLERERRKRLAQRSKTRGNRLIEQLTEEKLNVATMQKELIEKEIEEKDMKMMLLKEEMEYQKMVYRHRREMCELEKKEMLLKIQILQSSSRNTSTTNSYGITIDATSCEKNPLEALP